MKKILIGNDITLRWLIKNSEDQPIDFENTNAVVKIVHRDLPGVLFIPPFSREGNELTIFFPADKQKELGVYHLLLTFNDGHTVRIAARGVFYLSDIYDTDSHADSPFVETVDIDIIHVESEISMVNGRDGKNGKSAYQLAVANGFIGTEQEWLDSIVRISDNPDLQAVTDIGNTTTSSITVKQGTSSSTISQGTIRLSDNSSSTHTPSGKVDIYAEQANPIALCLTHPYTQEGVPLKSRFRTMIASGYGSYHKQAVPGDSVILKSGDGENLILGTASSSLPETELKRVILAPNNTPVETGGGLVVKAMPGNSTNVGIGVLNPTEILEIDSKTANTSGLKFTRFTSSSPSVPNAKPLGIDAEGKVVTVDAVSQTVYTQNQLAAGGIIVPAPFDFPSYQAIKIGNIVTWTFKCRVKGNLPNLTSDIPLLTGLENFNTLTGQFEQGASAIPFLIYVYGGSFPMYAKGTYIPESNIMVLDPRELFDVTQLKNTWLNFTLTYQAY